jgi:hypothetical protein
MYSKSRCLRKQLDRVTFSQKITRTPRESSILKKDVKAKDKCHVLKDQVPLWHAGKEAGDENRFLDRPVTSGRLTLGLPPATILFRPRAFLPRRKGTAVTEAREGNNFGFYLRFLAWY